MDELESIRINLQNQYSKETLDTIVEYCLNGIKAMQAVYYLSVLYSSMYPKIIKVIFNGPATIVFWSDKTKTVVKVCEGDVFDKEKGLAMAVAKKMLGTSKNKGNYYNEFRKWIPEEIGDDEDISDRSLPNKDFDYNSGWITLSDILGVTCDALSRYVKGGHEK